MTTVTRYEVFPDDLAIEKVAAYLEKVRDGECWPNDSAHFLTRDLGPAAAARLGPICDEIIAGRYRQWSYQERVPLLETCHALGWKREKIVSLGFTELSGEYGHGRCEAAMLLMSMGAHYREALAELKKLSLSEKEPAHDRAQAFLETIQAAEPISIQKVISRHRERRGIRGETLIETGLRAGVDALSEADFRYILDKGEGNGLVSFFAARTFHTPQERVKSLLLMFYGHQEADPGNLLEQGAALIHSHGPAILPYLISITERPCAWARSTVTARAINLFSPDELEEHVPAFLGYLLDSGTCDDVIWGQSMCDVLVRCGGFAIEPLLEYIAGEKRPGKIQAFHALRGIRDRMKSAK